jgi:hypothetical protein
MKEEALDRTMWRARFGRSFGPVVRQTAIWMNEWINECLSTLAESVLYDDCNKNTNTNVYVKYWRLNNDKVHICEDCCVHTVTKESSTNSVIGIGVELQRKRKLTEIAHISVINIITDVTPR